MKQSFIIRDERVRQNAIAAILKLDLEKPWDITIKPYVKKRSLDQNALYWKWLTIIHNETGQDLDDVHEILMRKFLEPRKVGHLARAIVTQNENGTPFETWSTKRLTTAQFSEYLEKILAWASDFGISLPLPEEAHRHDR